MRLTRRDFLGWLAGSVAAGFVPIRGLASSSSPSSPLPAGEQSGGSLRRDHRYPRRGFASFPAFADTGIYGAGTCGLPDGDLLRQALERGVRLVDTSPDYRNGTVEESVGRALEEQSEPIFTMTQIPVAAWEGTHRRVAFHRSLRRSLGRLRRGDVEALLVRNAEPGQLRDPQFREFARDVKEHGLVRFIGASGHGPDLEKVLELAQEDDLLEIILFGAHLGGFRKVPELLRAAHARGKILVAMKTREAALWNELPGWEREAERRRHIPWDGGWDPGFSRGALEDSLRATSAQNALVSLRTGEDLALLR
jgi:aryl-alcohol dehydrogenase-like predicted oxidoreductase